MRAHVVARQPLVHFAFAVIALLRAHVFATHFFDALFFRVYARLLDSLDDGRNGLCNGHAHRVGKYLGVKLRGHERHRLADYLRGRLLDSHLRFSRLVLSLLLLCDFSHQPLCTLHWLTLTYTSNSRPASRCSMMCSGLRVLWSNTRTLTLPGGKSAGS